MEIQFDPTDPDVATLPEAPSLDEEGVRFLEFVGKARGSLLEQGWMAGAVVVDGRLLTEELEHELSGSLCDDFDCIKIQVQELPRFLVEMFEECRSSVPRLLDLKDRITRDIRAGKEDAASELLLSFVSDLHVIISAYRNGRMLFERVMESGDGNESSGVFSENQSGDDNDPNFVDRFDRLRDTLTDVQDGFGRKDFVLVSDALEFEVPDLLNGLASDLQESVNRLRTLQGE
jgi:hypothetical protein